MVPPQKTGSSHLKATVPPYFLLNEYGDLSFKSRINIERYPVQKKKQSLEMCLRHVFMEITILIF